MLTYKIPALADTIFKPDTTTGPQTEKHQMTALMILALTAAIELSLALAYAVQGADKAYLEMYELKGNKP
jgi:hypothetical protein